MKSSPVQLRRELVLLAGATLLALVPLFFLWRRSVVSQASQAASASSMGALAPVVPRMAMGTHSFLSGAATLSPDGRWLARMEVSASVLGATPAPNSLSPIANELVVHSMRNGQEAFRALGAGKFAGWIPGTISFVSQNGDAINVFSPSVRAPGGAAPSQPWTQTTIGFTPDAGGMATSIGANGATEFELQAGAIAFSPDYRFAVKASWGKGVIVWEVADLTTGKVAPPVKAGRWLNYDPKVGGFSSDISVAVAPASIASGALPIVAVLQTTQPNFISATPTPRPSPTPFCTATPTPTLSPAQAQFKAKETRENAEIQAMVDSVEGVDGADPQVTDEDEIARITAEVKRRNRALDAEKRQIFPQSVLPTPTPAAKVSPWAMTKPFQIEAFDLSTRKRLWNSSIRSEIFTPQMKFAPDGSALLAWGTAVLRQQYGSPNVDGIGLEFRDARTGRVMKKTRLYDGDFGIPNENEIGVYADPSTVVNGTPRSVFVVKDAFSGGRAPDGKFEPYQRGTVFRFFNAYNAHETGYLKADRSRFSTDQRDFPDFSVSRGGNTWLWGNTDIFTLPRRELGVESVGPFPTPTPYATPTSKNHVSGH